MSAAIAIPRNPIPRNPTPATDSAPLLVIYSAPLHISHLQIFFVFPDPPSPLRQSSLSISRKMITSGKRGEEPADILRNFGLVEPAGILRNFGLWIWNSGSRCAQRRARIPISHCWSCFRDCDDPMYTSIACLSWSAPSLSAAAITSLGRLPRCRSNFARSRSNRGIMLGARSILFSKHAASLFSHPYYRPHAQSSSFQSTTSHIPPATKDPL